MRAFLKVLLFIFAFSLVCAFGLAEVDSLSRWASEALGSTAPWITEALAQVPSEVAEFSSKIWSWLLFALIVVGLLLGTMNFSDRSPARKNSKKLSEIVSEEGATTNGKPGDFTIRMLIVRYFLNIFRLQLGAPGGAPANVMRMEEESSGSHFTYELYVMHRGAWDSRRMSIGRLGEKTGSKSKCYYVIYDDHLVIKIPPSPLKDFDRYIKNIGADRHIVQELAPWECIVPTVSTVMKRVQSFHDTGGMTREALENKYIQWLRANPRFQDLLKIGESFAYFMDLSTYYTLGRVLEEIHNLREVMYREIVWHPDAIEEFQEFEGRYGHEKYPVYSEIKKAYLQYENAMRELVSRSALFSLPVYKMREWFLVHLSGRKVARSLPELDETLADELNALLGKIMEQNREGVKAYRDMVKEFVKRNAFDRNKGRMGGIVANLLELLGWLREKKVAMRDLKPDNLLVVGDPERYPYFLNTPERYSLGLIDVETAVDLNPKEGKRIAQPYLGGTPFYATPSHFVTNDVLRLSFLDVPRILHFQDWHGCIAIIYRAITGKHLFDQTAKILPGLLKSMEGIYSDKKNPRKVTREISRTFWKSAVTEFQKKTQKLEEPLRSIEISMSVAAKEMFRRELYKERKNLRTQIEKQINAQAIFRSVKNRRYLLAASSADLALLQAKWENIEEIAKDGPKGRTAGVKWFTYLHELKERLEKCESFSDTFKQAEPRLSVFEILELMFHSVLLAMYVEAWGPLSVEEVDQFETPPVDRSQEATEEIDIATLDFLM